MKTASNSFSKRLSLNVLALTSVLFVAAILVAAIYSHKLISEEATNSASNMLESVTNEVQAKLTEVESAVRNLAWVAKDNVDNEQKLYDLAVKMVNENPTIVGSAIAFREGFHENERFFSPYAYIDKGLGSLVSTQLGNERYNYFYMDWYLIPSLLGKPVWSEPYYDEGGGDQFMSTYSLPIFDSDGKVLAVVTADINLGWLSELVERIKPYENSFIYLVSKTGSFVAATDLNTLEGETLYTVAEELESSSMYDVTKAMMKGEKGFARFLYGKNRSFAVYGPLSNGWSAIISCQYKDILARTNRMRLVLILISIIGLGLLFMVCYFTVKKLTRPLVDFSDAAISIARGNFHTPLPEIKTDDEVGKMRESFDYMQKSLVNYIDRLKTTTSAKERIESELNIARKIQMHMVPTVFPKVDGIDLYAMIQPAKEVGGDLYDFFIKGNRLFFAIGDVSGKGVPASMFMAITRSAFRFIAGLGIPMNEVMSKINNSVSDGNSSGMFVTMFAACIDLETGHMEYCNAGHNPIIVKTPDGKAVFLEQIPNIAVGVFEDFEYKGQEITLEKGSSLFLYTDGVTEAEAADKSQFGEESLLAWASRTDISLSAEESVEELMTNVRVFTDGNEQNDDITIMALKV